MAVAIAAARIPTGLLYGVERGDPATFGAVIMALLGVTLLATYLPARRAARTDCYD